MHRDVYDQLVQVLCVPICAWPHFKLVAERFKVPVDSVISIYMQEAQLHVKRTHHLLKAAASKYASRYQNGAQLLELCAEADMFPCMFLRRLLEQVPWTCNKNAVTKIMRDPTVVKDLVRLNGFNSETAQKLLQDLQADVQQCVDCDQVYSPQADAKRLQLGIQYEQKLNKMLADAGIAFWTEEHLRDKGFFKTPDAKLQVPIAVKGRIVNWIDSKATFGDTKSHLEYNQEQFSKYVNRYGPGMVIYWFGFIDDLQGADADLVLVEDFPSAEDTMQLPQLPIPHDIIS